MVLPSKEHLEWADIEVGVIIHMDVQTFEPSYDFRKQRGYQPPAEVFAPMELDTDQWIKTAKSAGAGYAVLVAKHCSGFSLWPTEEHDYSIKKSPWKNGEGDIVGDFIKSCKKYNVKPGLYYSASCNAYFNVDNPGKVLDNNDVKVQEKYNNMVLAQLTELWSNYGNIFEIWFDGGCLPVDRGGPDIESLLHKLQPDALVFQGPFGTKSLLRWVGNERGIAPEDCFATVDFTPESFDGHDERIYGGNPFGLTWSPAESDLPNRFAKQAFQGGWFWREGEDHTLIPVDHLFDVYLKSIGRNTNMLIGMVINDKGLVPDADMQIFKSFGKKVANSFGKPLIELTQTEIINQSDKYNYTLTLPQDINAKYLVIMEDISKGELILEYAVNDFIKGKCIGHKKIIELPTNTTEITFKVLDSKKEPCLRSIAIY